MCVPSSVLQHLAFRAHLEDNQSLGLAAATCTTLPGAPDHHPSHPVKAERPPPLHRLKEEKVLLGQRQNTVKTHLVPLGSSREPFPKSQISNKTNKKINPSDARQNLLDI